MCCDYFVSKDNIVGTINSLGAIFDNMFENKDSLIQAVAKDHHLGYYLMILFWTWEVRNYISVLCLDCWRHQQG